jgi:hypothetical protein
VPSYCYNLHYRHFLPIVHRYVGRDSVVGKVTCYGLDGPGIESQWGRDFSQLSRPALGPTQHPIQWVLGLFPGGKAAGAWSWPPTGVKERVELYLYSPSGPLWPVLGRTLPLYTGIYLAIIMLKIYIVHKYFKYLNKFINFDHLILTSTEIRSRCIHVRSYSIRNNFKYVMTLTYFNLFNILLLISSVIVSHSALYTKPFYTEYFQYASIFFYTRDQASTTKKK